MTIFASLAAVGFLLLSIAKPELGHMPHRYLVKQTIQASEWTKIEIPGLSDGVPVYAVDRTGDQLIVGTEGEGLFLGDIHGERWQQPVEFSDAYVRDVWPEEDINGVVIAATIGDGLLKRFGYSNPWSTIENGAESSRFYSLSGSGSTIFAGMVDGGVLKSLDAGTSWESVGPVDSPGVLSLAAVSDRTVYAGSVDNGLFKTSDGALHWSQIALSGRTVRAVEIDPSDPNLIIASSFGDGVVKSIDGGSSWFELNDGIADLRTYSLIMINFNNQSIVLAGTEDNGVYILDNQHWEPSGLVGLTVYSLSYSNGKIYAGTDQGVWQNSPVKIPQPRFTLEQFVIGLGSLPEQQRQILREFLIEREPSILASNSVMLARIIVGLISIVTVLLSYVFDFPSTKRKPGLRFTSLLIALQVGSLFVIALFTLMVRSAPSSIILFLDVRSVFDLHPKGISYLLKLVQFGSSILWLNTLICVALAVTYFAYDATRNFDNQVQDGSIKAPKTSGHLE